MTRPQSISISLLIVTLLALGGCTGLDVLEPQPDKSRNFLFESRLDPEDSANLDPHGPAILIGAASVAKHLDQNRIAIRNDENRIQYSALNRWAEPIVENVNRVLAERLSLDLNTSQVGFMRSMADMQWEYRIGYHINEFAGMPGESVRLNVSWWIDLPEQNKAAYTSFVTEIEVDGNSGDFEAYVRALQAAVEQWASEVGSGISGLLSD